MAFRTKRNVGANNLKPLTLSDGTEVYEISESFSVNSLIDISFSRTRPVRTRHQELYRQLDACIEELPINTEQARLNFVGCSLNPPDRAINASIDASFASSENNLYTSKPSSSASTLSPAEIPFETHQRLTRQLTAFARDLQQYDSASADPLDKANVALIASGVKALNATLIEVSKARKYKQILSKHYRAENTANMALNETMRAIRDPNSRPAADESAAEASQDDAMLAMYGGDEDSWLLYRHGRGVKTVGTADADFLDVEQRISAIEDCVGFVTDMKNPYPDALQAVSLLSSRFEFVFSAQWASMKKSASAMMSDLKNIKYHLDLMQARYKPTEKQTRMEWERLEDLWRMMRRWDHVVFELVSVVKRLKSLQNYHARTCKFIGRVNKLFEQQCFIQQSLDEDEKTLQRSLQSMRDNAKQMEKNAMFVTNRLSVLSEKLKPVNLRAAYFENKQNGSQNKPPT